MTLSSADMNDILRSMETYSPTARAREKARQRRRDQQLVKAGRAEEVQATNRLIANPKEWRLEVGEEPVNE